MVRATSSAGMGEPFSELKGVGKSEAKRLAVRSGRAARWRSMGMAND
jgi:hypothetical protein